MERLNGLCCLVFVIILVVVVVVVIVVVVVLIYNDCDFLMIISMILRLKITVSSLQRPVH